MMREAFLPSSAAARAGSSFARFGTRHLGCLYDVIDVDGGEVPMRRLDRPNQLFAVSLPYSVLSAEQMRAVVDTCARELVDQLRPAQLERPRIPPTRAATSATRGSATRPITKGTVWSWLLGPFARRISACTAIRAGEVLSRSHGQHLAMPPAWVR
jgi:glycogen debranching enzyme